MAVLDVVLYPDAPLKDKATPYETIGPEMPALARDMLETMEAYEGVGLAGPQVGISKRIFVLCEPDSDPMCLINPEIELIEGREEGEEGCLSLPQLYTRVPRATHIHVKAYDEYGTLMEFDAYDFLARIIQHENDHLDGIVFPDRLDILSREDALQQWTEIRNQLTEAAER
jgi:peptide deformylase